jgi:molybdopterin molybdotransferase
MVLRHARRSSGTEIVQLSKANGRVLAINMFSRIAHPPFDRSAVDGYGIGKDDIDRPAPHTLRLIGKVRAGDDPSTMQIGGGTTIRLATGAAVPSSVAGIVMEEHSSSDGGTTTTILRGVSPSENIRRRGEDVASGGIIAQRGTTLDARHIAMLAAVGHCRVTVMNKTRISILSTGSELTEGFQETLPGTIFDSNRPMLMALLARNNVKLHDAGLYSDDPENLAIALRAEAERSAATASCCAFGSTTAATCCASSSAAAATSSCCPTGSATASRCATGSATSASTAACCCASSSAASSRSKAVHASKRSTLYSTEMTTVEQWKHRGDERERALRIGC